MAWTKKDLKRAYPCNPELLRYYREAKGWTQSELARAAGYSERLVNKAESGSDISTVAIADLAEALSTSSQMVCPEDLIGDPVTLAKAYIAALYTHGKDTFAAIRHFLDDELVVKISGDPEQIPFAGEFYGPAEFERALAIFFTFLQPPVNHDHKPWYAYTASANDVFVIGKCWIHAIGKPLDQPLDLVNHFKFRRGKMYYFDDHYDTLAVTHILGKLPAMPS